MLDELYRSDGWKSVDGPDGREPAIVTFNCRVIRGCEPRFPADRYPYRSTFGYFPPHLHAHGNWWQLESHSSANNSIFLPFPVPILIVWYHSQPKEKEPEEGAQEGVRPQQILGREGQVGRAIVPAEPIEAAEDGIELLPPPIQPAERDDQAPAGAPAEPQDINIMPEWTSWDLGAALRSLRSDNQALQNRALRRLHIRLFHATSAQMISVLKAAGVSSSVLQLVAPIVETCKICRAWQRPGHRSITTTRMSEKFNEIVQCDLVFVEEFIILHLVDEALRWSATSVLPDRTAGTVLKTIT